MPGRAREYTFSQLRRNLPLSARGKPALLAFLRSRAVNVRPSSRLVVTDVFDAGAALGLMCRFVLRDEVEGVFVAPLAQIVLERRRAAPAADPRGLSP